MIGNDIIDIVKAKKDSDWQRPRFLDKLFTENEQKLIERSEDSFLTVWYLWSIKEAAYKLYTQLNPSRFYNPKKFECFVEENDSTVKFEDFKCYVETIITSNYIISEAKLKPSKLKSKVIQFETENIKSSSLILKQKLMNSISENLRISKKDITFKKDEFGVPTVNFLKDKKQISLSHHGRFGAYAIAW